MIKHRDKLRKRTTWYRSYITWCDPNHVSCDVTWCHVISRDIFINVPIYCVEGQYQLLTLLTPSPRRFYQSNKTFVTTPSSSNVGDFEIPFNIVRNITPSHCGASQFHKSEILSNKFDRWNSNKHFAEGVGGSSDSYRNSLNYNRHNSNNYM